MRKLSIGAAGLVAVALVSGFTWSPLVSGFTWSYFGQRQPVEFFAGHTHDEDGMTEGAPQHSDGLDRYGCHNGSVPYHCH